ncbi:glutamate receptor 2-like [Tubulanus polymorphus]|uniref:glutamate receptor 2-like n=1 Tax=Tubulanus polymorphus TaxID=672921 RepID=UPI003DA3DA8C
MEIIWVGVYVLGLLHYVATFPSDIPIGAIFDRHPLTVFQHTAFQYGIFRHNLTYIFDLAPKVQFVRPDDNLNFTTALCDNMKEGIMLSYGVQTPEVLNAIHSYSRTFHLPYVTVGPVVHHTNYHPSPFVLHVQPDYVRAIKDIIKFYNWDRIHYMYTSKEGLMRLEALTQMLDADVNITADIKMNVHYVYNTDDVYGILRTLDSVDHKLEFHRNIILDMPSHSSLMSILRQVREMGMNRDKYHYIIAGYDIDSLSFDGFHYSGVNVTGFRIHSPGGRMRKFSLEWQHLDTKLWPGAGTTKISYEAALAYDATKVIGRALDKIRAQNKDIFKYNFRRGQLYNNGTEGLPCKLPIIPWAHGPEIMRQLTSVKFKGLTGKIMFDDRGFRKDYTIEIRGLKGRSGLEKASKVGEWDDKNGVNINESYTKKRRKSSISKVMRVTSIESKPFLTVRKLPEDGTPLVGNQRFEGYCVDLAELIAKEANFEYTIKLVKDKKYGAFENDSWNGMIGELIYKKTDLVIAPLTITSQRERVVEFSKPFMNLGISIMISKPENQKPGVFSFFDPLSSKVWALVTVAGLLVSFILFVISRISPYEWDIEKDVYGVYASNEFGIANSMWFALGTFMQQGGDTSPRSFSGRIVTSVWSLFTLILISSYTANLAAFLTIERMYTPINSVEDLEGQTDIKYGSLNSGSTKAFFEQSQIHVYKRMWDFMKNAKPSVFVETTEEGVQRVRDSKSKYAFLLESTMNDYANNRKPCNTMKVGDNLDSKGYGVATQLNSKFRNKVNLAVLKLRENEALTGLEKKWWYDKSECMMEGSDNVQRPLGLSNVAGIFYILIGGLGIAMAISLVEFLIKSRAESKKKQTSFRVAMRHKAQLSVRGITDDASDRSPKTDIMYTYTAPAPLITYDGIDGHSHTEV